MSKKPALWVYLEYVGDGRYEVGITRDIYPILLRPNREVLGYWSYPSRRFLNKLKVMLASLARNQSWTLRLLLAQCPSGVSRSVYRLPGVITALARNTTPPSSPVFSY